MEIIAIKIKSSKFFILLIKYIMKLNVTNSVNTSPRIDKDSEILIEFIIVNPDQIKKRKYIIKGRLFIDLPSSVNKFFLI